MSFLAHSTDDDSGSNPPTCAEQLRELAHTLPRHIEHTVLPQISEEVACAAADLSAQADGIRQLLLQSAVLRRSAVLAPVLKQQLVRHASHLQRRRAQLVQILQKQEKRWRTATASASAGPRFSPRGGDAATAAELQAVWHVLAAAMQGEEKFVPIVHAPLCPSAATLRAFLQDAVTVRDLHRRVLAQVENRNRSPTAVAGGAANARGMQKMPRKGPGSASPAPPQPSEATAETADAIEEALHLLLHHIRLQEKKADQAEHTTAAAAHGRGKTTRRCINSASPHVVSPSSVDGVSGGAVCDVDGGSNSGEDGDSDSDGALQLVAEEDVDLPNPHAAAAVAASWSPCPPSPSPPPPQQQQQQQLQQQLQQQSVDSPTTSLSSSSSSGLWLTVPGIVSLGQYCADLPWVADLAEQRYGDAREQQRHSSSSGAAGGSGGGGGEMGYFSRHTPAEAKDIVGKGSQTQSRHAFSSLNPLGGFFPPALAVGAAAAKERAGTVTTTATTAAAGAARSLCVSMDLGRHTRSPTVAGDARDGMFPGSDAPGDDRASLARSVVQCVSSAVDDAWRDVEENAVVPFCAASSASTTTKKSAQVKHSNTEKDRDTAVEDEEEMVSAFFQVMKVRYAVELSAQVVAARQAVELLLDSEDSVIFDGARLLDLSLTTAERLNSQDSMSRQAGQQDTRSTVRARNPSALLSPASSVLSCTVLTLPGLEEVFYVVAYCTGAAVLREAAAVLMGAGHSCAERNAAPQPSSSPSSSSCIIDVDAQDGNVAATALSRVDLTNEEDTADQQRASLHAWAVDFEKRFLACPSADSAASSSFASLFRLWLYLWEFVFAVPSATAASRSEKSSGDADTSTMLTSHANHMGGRGVNRRHAGGAPAQLLVSLHTARRWMEKVLDAALCRGIMQCGVIRGAEASQLPWPAFWTPSEADLVVRRTTAEARQALLRAAGVETSV